MPNSVALRSFGFASRRRRAEYNWPGNSSRCDGSRSGSAEHFGVEPILEGKEAGTALLSNARAAINLFGYPSVTVEQMIEWVADWIGMGGATLAKPTHFEARDGRF